MKKTQLDNLIEFSFLLKSTNILSCDPGYILEKYNKYIGFSPKKPGVSFDLFSNNKSYFHGYIVKWFDTWDKDGVHWDIISPIIRYISQVSGFYIPGTDINSILKEFIESIGDLESVNDVSYNHIHHNTNRIVDAWKKKNIREYNLIILS